MSHSEVLPQITPEESAIDLMIAEGGPTFSQAHEAKLKAANNYSPGDAEGFLVNNAHLWSTVESRWQSMKAAKDDIYYAAEGGFIVLPGPDGKPVEAQMAQGLPRHLRRIAKSSGTFAVNALVENTIKMDNNTMVDAVANGMFTGEHLLLYDTTTTPALVKKLEGTVYDYMQDNVLYAKSKLPDIHIKHPENPDLKDAVDRLMQHHFQALIAQKIAHLRLNDFFEDDANVVPFLEQVSEVLDIRKQGVNEFPGFLETLASHIGESTGNSHPLQEAIIRTAEQRHPRRDFVEAMLSGSVAQGGKQSKEFLGSVSGVQMAASIIGRRFAEQGVDRAAIINALTDSFEELPPEWEAAYQADVQAKRTLTWQNLCDNLKPYERRGRFTPNSQTKAAYRFGIAGSVNSKKRRVQSAGEDIVRDLAVDPTEQEQAPRQLAVLRRMEGASREFSLDRVEDVPALLGHSVLRSFFDSYGNEPGMHELVDTMLGDILADPCGSINSKVLRPVRFTVKDEQVRRQQVFRMRRFKPNTSSATTGTQGNRVRIIYGLVSSTIGNIVAVKSVEMRREAY